MKYLAAAIGLATAAAVTAAAHGQTNAPMQQQMQTRTEIYTCPTSLHPQITLPADNAGWREARRPAVRFTHASIAQGNIVCHYSAGRRDGIDDWLLTRPVPAGGRCEVARFHHPQVRCLVPLSTPR